MKVKRFYSYSDEDFAESRHKLSDLGMIELQYFPPAHNVSVLRIEVSYNFYRYLFEIPICLSIFNSIVFHAFSKAEYLDLKEALPPIGASISPSNTFIQAVLKTKNPAVSHFRKVKNRSAEEYLF